MMSSSDDRVGSIGSGYGNGDDDGDKVDDEIAGLRQMEKG